jgi:L-lysine 2,3-aminomutase
MAGVLCRGVIANDGYICEPQTLSKGLFAICILPFYVFQLQLVKFIIHRRKSKNIKPNFLVLSVTRTTTFSKDVYTFKLQFWIEK